MIALRSIIYNLYFYSLTVSMILACLPLLLLPRQVTVRAMHIWARLTIGGLAVICGTKFEVRGREHVPDTPVLVASKHQSMWDTIIFLTLFDNPAIVLKQELLWIPLYGWFAQKVGMIAVNRGAHAKALKKMIADGRDCLGGGRSIVIFPEGTRKAPGATPDYKPGIAALYTHLDHPCVPVAVNSGLFWPRRKMLRLPGTIVLEYLPPIPAGLKRKAFMAELEQTIEQATEKLITQT